jgi:hypothetical protein
MAQLAYCQPDKEAQLASRKRESRQRFEPQDVGTLWTLRRDEYTASCTLLSWSPDWELRVVMEKDILLAKRCRTTVDAFELAEHWRRGLLEHGWEQIMPMASGMSSARHGRRDGTAADLRAM